MGMTRRRSIKVCLNKKKCFFEAGRWMGDGVKGKEKQFVFCGTGDSSA